MRTILPVLAVLASVLAVGPSHSAPPSPLGLWQGLDDDTKQPSGWFLIREQNGVLVGVIAKMFLKPGEDPNAVCDQCKDDRKDHPWLGLELIRGMQQEKPDKWGGGTILDPRDGKTYKATMTVSPDGQTLTVHGYVGFELLGRDQYWQRVPDSAMSQLDPSVNPNPTPAAPGPGRKPVAPNTMAPNTMAPKKP